MAGQYKGTAGSTDKYSGPGSSWKQGKAVGVGGDKPEFKGDKGKMSAKAEESAKHEKGETKAQERKEEAAPKGGKKVGVGAGLLGGSNVAMPTSPSSPTKATPSRGGPSSAPMQGPPPPSGGGSGQLGGGISGGFGPPKPTGMGGDRKKVGSGAGFGGPMGPPAAVMGAGSPPVPMGGSMLPPGMGPQMGAQPGGVIPKAGRRPGKLARKVPTAFRRGR